MLFATLRFAPSFVDTGGQEPTDRKPYAEVRNIEANVSSSTEVTLSGSYTGASSSPAELGFYWGTSSNSLTNKLTVSSVTATGTDSGTFEAHLSDLVPGKSYVFQAFARVSGTGSYSSDEQVFYAATPTVFKMPEGVQPAVDKDWLELASAKKGSQYVVSTTYAGERNYTVFYDTQMTTPLWTAYPLASGHMGSNPRPSSWSYNPNIDEKYQVRVTDGSYSNSTYSRGHMCPNGSRNGNATMQAQTFYVTNQVPQIQDSFNSGIWSNLENAVQGIAKSHNEEIYVVTGVAFEKEGETRTINYTSPKSSSQRVPIPNYFYKLVLRVKYSGRTISDASCIAFWFDHKAYSDSYQNYTVSVDLVEAWTGFDFFVNLPDDLESAAESKTPTWSSFTSF